MLGQRDQIGRVCRVALDIDLAGILHSARDFLDAQAVGPRAVPRKSGALAREQSRRCVGGTLQHAEQSGHGARRETEARAVPEQEGVDQATRGQRGITKY